MKEKEEARLLKLKEIESKLHTKEINYVAGIDEAGRGPLARSGCSWVCNITQRVIYRRH